MAAQFLFDPTPVPVGKYAESMGTTAETLILRHNRGEFPALRKIGRDWYVMPAAVVRMSVDGDQADGREMEGELGRPEREAEDVPQPNLGRGRRTAQRSRQGQNGGIHPLDR